MEGISRIDSNDTHGWYLRIYYEDNEVVSKFFSDSVHGGTKQALTTAINYRQEYTQERPTPIKLPVRRKMLPQNKTGVHGVSETFDRRKNGQIVPCFNVSWQHRKGVAKCKKFFHHHYDTREDCLAAAKLFREERELEILKRFAKEQGLKLEDLQAAIKR
jgi:hypothetical protein